jgi:periplasmic divalent cation tolerance protein
MNAIDCILIYVTCKDKTQAIEIGNALVKEKLCACVNIYPIESIYHWDNEIIHDQEITMICKSTQSNYIDIENRIKNLHSYENPCIISFKILEGSSEYLKWIRNSVR